MIRLARTTRQLIMVMLVITLTASGVAYYYYDGIRRAVDPRTITIRKDLLRYQTLLDTGRYLDVFPLLDTIEDSYAKMPAYQNSYEPGVLANNRASAYIMMALYVDETSDTEKQQLLALAEESVSKAINLYETWLATTGQADHNTIQTAVNRHFSNAPRLAEVENLPELIQGRIDEIILAQKEVPRRLSVSYTNLGIIQRHQLRQEEALQSYQQAIDLWSENYTARDNLNVLLDRPVEERSVINKLFPPDRD